MSRVADVASSKSGKAWSALREDLSIYPAEPSPEGQPTWNIYDPLVNTYFHIGWLEYEIYSRWHLQSKKRIAQRVTEETTLPCTVLDVENAKRFLKFHHLLKTDEQYQMPAEKSRSFWKLILGSLGKLFMFRVRLLSPDVFLSRTLPYIKFIYTKRFFYSLIMLALFSLYLIAQQWDQFMHTFTYYFSIKGLFYYFLASITMKFLHEFGHAYTAKRYGCSVPTIGVAFLFLWPLFYTDVTDTWRIQSRIKRAAVGCGGVSVELIFAVFASLLWVFLPDSAVKSVCFFIGTVSWVMAVGLNINPFIHFDGYYVLSDLINVPNLRERAGDLGAWMFREVLFGFGEPPPVKTNIRLRRWLVLYALLARIVRFIIFFGIAISIYRRFFKLLGLLLMFLILYKMIAKPILSQIYEIWSRRHMMRINKNTLTTMTVTLLLIVLSVVPWRTTLRVPGLITFETTKRHYAPISGKLTNIVVQRGQSVNAGQILYTFSSPEIDKALVAAKKELSLIHYRYGKERGKTTQFGYQQAGAAELTAKQSQYNGLLKLKKRLQVVSTFSGRLIDPEPGLQIGLWMTKGSYLATTIKPKDTIIYAYIPEVEVNRIHPGSQAQFVQNHAWNNRINLTVVRIEPYTLEAIDAPYLASMYGGQLPVTKDPSGQYVLRNSYYRAVLQPEGQHFSIDKIQAGTVILTGEPRSFVTRLWRSLYGVLIRETGF